jgi:hypothetical protein
MGVGVVPLVPKLRLGTQSNEAPLRDLRRSPGAATKQSFVKCVPKRSLGTRENPTRTPVSSAPESGKREQLVTGTTARGGGLRAMIRFGKTAGKSRGRRRRWQGDGQVDGHGCPRSHRRFGGLLRPLTPDTSPPQGRGETVPR